MNTGGSEHQHPNTKSGIIILGNTGAGKSFLCNILIGKKRFVSDFSAKAVTLETESDTMSMDGKNDLLVFNIPGLIERKQERIEQNKKEIIKAFQQCPESIVIFVWSAQKGGRPQGDDIIGFAALYKAYEFPTSSFLYVINGVPADKNNEIFQAEFLTEIKEGLGDEKLNIDPKDTVFVEHTSFDNKIHVEAQRDKLLKCIKTHHPALQSKKSDIILQVDELKNLREHIRRLQEQAAKDEGNHQRRINEMRNVMQHHKENSEGTVHNPVDPLTAIGVTAASMTTHAAHSTVTGFGTGFAAVGDGIQEFLEDKSIPAPVRIVTAPVAVAAGVVIAPAVGLLAAVKGFFDGAKEGTDAARNSIFGNK